MSDDKSMRKKKYTRKHYSKYVSGGKTTASSFPVKLVFMTEQGVSKEVACSVCGSNHYKETIGTLGKSKVRQGVGQFFFGEAAEVLDTTSIITYFCNMCGVAVVVRNLDTTKIIAQPIST